MTVSSVKAQLNLHSSLKKFGLTDYGFYNDLPATATKIESGLSDEEVVELWLSSFKELSLMDKTQLEKVG